MKNQKFCMFFLGYTFFFSKILFCHYDFVGQLMSVVFILTVTLTGPRVT